MQTIILSYGETLTVTAPDEVTPPVPTFTPDGAFLNLMLEESFQMEGTPDDNIHNKNVIASWTAAKRKQMLKLVLMTVKANSNFNGYYPDVIEGIILLLDTDVLNDTQISNLFNVIFFP